MSNTYNTKKPNTELNERIAREVMGWRQHDEFKHLWYTQDSMKPGLTLPNFSGDMNDAWLVIDALELKFEVWNYWTLRKNKCFWYSSEQNGSEGNPLFWATGETTAHAICLAALKTVSK